MSKIVEKFYKYLKNLGFNDDILNYEKLKGSEEMLYFYEENRDGLMFKIAFVFNDNDVDIFVSKHIESNVPDNSYKIINDLNIKYQNLDFFIVGNAAVIKCEVGKFESIDFVFDKFALIYYVALNELSAIK